MGCSLLAVDLLGGFPFDVLQLVDLALLEEGVLEDEVVVLLFHLMKVIHVELG